MTTNHMDDWLSSSCPHDSNSHPVRLIAQDDGGLLVQYMKRHGRFYV